MDPEHECRTLDDYRRYAHYRRDPDLQRLHAHLPIITTIDDHEICNDTWRDDAKNHGPAEDGDCTPARRPRCAPGENGCGGMAAGRRGVMIGQVSTDFMPEDVGDPSVGAGILTSEEYGPNPDQWDGYPAENNPHIRLCELDLHSYLLLELDADRVRAEWHYVDQLHAPSDRHLLGDIREVRAGDLRLVEVRRAPQTGP
jgi:phosphodiesterase/alkaline phosphatase D-like protein